MRWFEARIISLLELLRKQFLIRVVDGIRLFASSQICLSLNMELTQKLAWISNVYTPCRTYNRLAGYVMSSYCINCNGMIFIMIFSINGIYILIALHRKLLGILCQSSSVAAPPGSQRMEFHHIIFRCFLDFFSHFLDRVSPMGNNVQSDEVSCSCTAKCSA